MEPCWDDECSAAATCVCIECGHRYCAEHMNEIYCDTCWCRKAIRWILEQE